MEISFFLKTIFLCFATLSETQPTITGHIFVLTAGGNPNDPLAYVPYHGTVPVPECPGNGRICSILVLTGDLYRISDAPAPPFVGQPKVDVNTSSTNELYDQIQDAISIPGKQNPQILLNGRIIHEQN